MQQRQEASDLARLAASDPDRELVLMHRSILSDPELRGRRLLMILLDSAAAMAGRRVIEVSTRELAALINQSSQAVANGLDALADRGYLVVIHKPGRGQKEAWTIEVRDPAEPKLIGQREPQRELFDPGETIEQEADPQVIKLAAVTEEATGRLVRPPEPSREAEDVRRDVHDMLLAWGWHEAEAAAVAALLAEEALQRGPGRPRPWWDRWSQVVAAVKRNNPKDAGPYVRACLRNRNFPVK